MQNTSLSIRPQNQQRLSALLLATWATNQTVKHHPFGTCTPLSLSGCAHTACARPDTKVSHRARHVVEHMSVVNSTLHDPHTWSMLPSIAVKGHSAAATQTPSCCTNCTVHCAQPSNDCLDNSEGVQLSCLPAWNKIMHASHRGVVTSLLLHQGITCGGVEIHWQCCQSRSAPGLERRGGGPP